MVTIPLIAALLYLIGGQWWKLARWLLIGTYVFIVSLFYNGNWWYVFSILTYFIATNAFSYGDKMWTSKIFGRWVSMGISGLTYGLASMIVLGVFWGTVQGIIGLVSFLVLKYLDDTDKLKNPWQELCRGFLGTCMFIIK